MLKSSGRAFRGLLVAAMAAGLSMAGDAQSPNPRNTAAIAAGKEAMASMEQELTAVRSTIAAVEAASQQAPAYKVYAAWLEGQIALGKQSFEAAKPPAKAVVEKKAAEAKAGAEAARVWRETRRTEFNALISNTAIDQRPLVRPELEAILNAEGSNISIADQLARDFDNVQQALGEGTPPYALFNARAQMREQAAAMLKQSSDAIAVANEKLKALTTPG
jgi:hypothetical protein